MNNIFKLHRFLFGTFSASPPIAHWGMSANPCCFDRGNLFISRSNKWLLCLFPSINNFLLLDNNQTVLYFSLLCWVFSGDWQMTGGEKKNKVMSLVKGHYLFTSGRDASARKCSDIWVPPLWAVVQILWTLLEKSDISENLYVRCGV